MPLPQARPPIFSNSVTDEVPRRWTLGSVLFLSSFAVMMGPWAYFRHLISTPRLPFTSAYFGSLALTIYFSIGVSQANIDCLASYAKPSQATQHHPDPSLGRRPTSLSNMVSGELLPHGFRRLAACDYVWSSQGSGLGERLTKSVALVSSWHNHVTLVVLIGISLVIKYKLSKASSAYRNASSWLYVSVSYPFADTAI